MRTEFEIYSQFLEETRTEYDRLQGYLKSLEQYDYLLSEERGQKMLVDAYDEGKLPVGRYEAHKTLQHLLQTTGLKQDQLIRFFGSRKKVSDVVNGVVAILDIEAVALGELFKLPPGLFKLPAGPWKFFR